MPKGRERPRGRERASTLEARHIKLVKNMMWVLLVILLVVLVLGVLVPEGLGGLLTVPGLLFLMMIVLVVVAMQRLVVNNLNQAVLLIVSGAFIVLGYITVRSGVIDPPFSYLFAYALPLVFSALLVGRRGLVFAGVVSVLLVGGTYLAELAGHPWVGVVTEAGNRYLSLVIFGLVLFLIAYFLDRLGVELRIAHSRALGREQELAKLVSTLEEEIQHRRQIEKEREQLLTNERAARMEAEELA